MEYGNLGGLDEENQETEKTVLIEEKEKRIKPYHVWKVGKTEYKLKLTTAMILKLENKYRCNVSTLVITDDIPPLAVMLTIIHAAMNKFEHGISYEKVQSIYEKWTEEDGGNQQLLYSNVVMPIMAVSGFFTEKQMQTIAEAVEEVMN